MSRRRGAGHAACVPEDGGNAASGVAVADTPDARAREDAPMPVPLSARNAHCAAHGVVGVLLAGGLSTRLGQDKTRLRLHGETAPGLLARTAELLRSVTGEVWISCRGNHPCPLTEADVGGPYHRLDDEVEGMGPFGGVFTALRRARGPVLVLSCDLPFMERVVLERLLAHRAARRPEVVMTTFRQEKTGFIESLVAVYEPGALPLFRRALARGERKLSRVVPPELRGHIPYPERDALPFFNINYPADLAMARRILGVP